MTKIRFSGIDLTELARVFAQGHDHGGNPVEPYTDTDGGWPLRCCLQNSTVGDEIALIAWTPFDKKGAYAETGPIFVHANSCPGPVTEDVLSSDLDKRAMVLRPYTHDQRIAYHHVRHVPEDESLAEHLAELLEELDVDFVHGRNIRGGCYAFKAAAV